MTIHKLDITPRPNAKDMYAEFAEFIDGWLEKGVSLADVCLMLDLNHHAIAMELVTQEDTDADP